LIAVYFFSGNLTFPRTIFPIYWMLNWAGLVVWRLAVKRTAGQRKRRALIVGTGTLAEQLIAELERTPEIGIEVVGIVSDRVSKGEYVDRYEVYGPWSPWPSSCRTAVPCSTVRTG
jgi:FlaA1/EpsC-like NDP-sugar epimerase